MHHRATRRQSSDADANWLLGALPSTAYDALLPHREDVRLEHGEILARPYEPMDYANFPRGCALSILVPMENRGAVDPVEAATVGWEGVVGVPLYLAQGGAGDSC